MDEQNRTRSPVSDVLVVSGPVASFGLNDEEIVWLEPESPGRLLARALAGGPVRRLATVPGTREQRLHSWVSATATHALWYDGGTSGGALKAAPLSGGDVYDAQPDEIHVIPMVAWADGALVDRRGGVVLCDAAGRELRILRAPTGMLPGLSVITRDHELACWGAFPRPGSRGEIACAHLGNGQVLTVRAGGVLVLIGAAGGRFVFAEGGHLYVLEKGGTVEVSHDSSTWPLPYLLTRSRAGRVCAMTFDDEMQTRTKVLCVPPGPPTIVPILRDLPIDSRFELSEDFIYYIADDGIRRRELPC
jgi:hypothetical protein